MDRDSSPLLSDIVERLLQEEGFNIDKLKPTQDEDDHIVSFRIFVQGLHGEWTCLLRCFEESQRIVAYSIFPHAVPEALRPRLSEMICRINYGLIMGNFEMDWSDGELRYKTSTDIEGIQLTTTMLRNLVYVNFHSVDMYFDALMAGLTSDKDVDLIVMHTENPHLNGFDLVDEIVH